METQAANPLHQSLVAWLEQHPAPQSAHPDDPMVIAKLFDAFGSATWWVTEYDRANLAGNHVALECGEVHVVMAHLKTGSVQVGQGDEVVVGQPLAEIGNSGGTGEPHLHLHVQRPGPPGLPLGGDPVPARIGGRFLVRGDQLDGDRPDGARIGGGS